MRTDLYDGNWADSHPQASRVEILADAFHAGAEYPARHLLLNLSMVLAPVFVILAAAGLFAAIN